MDSEMFVYIGATLLGVVGGCSANWFPASGKTALVLSLLPVAGFGLMIAFC